MMMQLPDDALAALARGDGFQPLRSILFPPNATGGMGLMPAYRGGERPTYALKAINVVPDNPRVRLRSAMACPSASNCQRIIISPAKGRKPGSCCATMEQRRSLSASVTTSLN